MSRKQESVRSQTVDWYTSAVDDTENGFGLHNQQPTVEIEPIQNEDPTLIKLSPINIKYVSVVMGFQKALSQKTCMNYLLYKTTLSHIITRARNKEDHYWLLKFRVSRWFGGSKESVSMFYMETTILHH